MEIPAKQSNAHITPEENTFQQRTPDTIVTGEPFLEGFFDPFLQFPLTQDTSDLFYLQNFQPSPLTWTQYLQPEVYELANTNWRLPVDCPPLTTEQHPTTLYPLPIADSTLDSNQANHTQIHQNILPSLYQNDASFSMEGTAQYSETTGAKPPLIRKKEIEPEKMAPRVPGKRSRIKSEPCVDPKIKVKPEVKYDGDEDSKANKKQRAAPKPWSVEEDKAMLDGVMEAMHGKWTVVAQHPHLANRDANRCTMRMKSIINRVLKNPDRKE